MTSYVYVTRHERVGGEYYDWAIWVNDAGRERIWFLTDDPSRFPIGKRYQI